MKKIISQVIVMCLLLLSWSLLSFTQAAWESSWNIKDETFKIHVGTFTPGNTSLIGEWAWETVENVLLTVLEKLIIVFWVFAVFIMTIGAGYMIIYHGQDEFLSKWKSIFMSGIIALAVALSAGVIVRLFALLLY